MRVAIVIDRLWPTGGGAERSTLQLAAELALRGHDVEIITGSAPRDLAVPGVGVHALAGRSSGSALRLWRFTRFARRRLETGGYDTALSVTLSVPAAVVQPRSGCIDEVHARNVARRRRAVGRLAKRLGAALSLKQQMLRRLEHRTVRDPLVQRFAPVSRYGADQLMRHHGIEADRIVVIPNASTMPRVDDEQREAIRRELRASLQLTHDEYVLLFAAMNPSLKGFVPLLEAAQRLHRESLAVKMLLAGRFEYGELMQIARAGLRDHVRMIGPTESMADLYVCADVTVLPTFFDPSSKVVIESLMLGVPAISTRFNGASDFILDPTGDGAGPAAGRVIDDPADVVALAQAIRELADADERARCRAATTGLAEHLSMRRHVDQLEEVLLETAGRGQTSDAAAVTMA